jgi:hypothetical protein
MSEAKCGKGFPGVAALARATIFVNTLLAIVARPPFLHGAQKNLWRLSTLKIRVK